MKPSWRVRGKSLQLRYAYTDINGKKVTQYETVSDYNDKGRRNSDAQRDKLWEEFAERCRKQAVNVGSSMTVKEICLHHVESTPGLSPQTIRSHRINIERHLSGTFGRKKASKVRRREIKAWVKYLSEDYKKADGTNLSPKTVKNIFALLSASFHTAVKDDILTSNPCVDIPLPKVQKKEVGFYDLDTAVAFVRALDTITEDFYNYKVGLLLAMMCGLRRGEICGILHEDVDYEKSLIHVNQSVFVQTGGQRIIKDLKSYSSHRVVSVPDSLMEEIVKLNEINERRKEKMGSLWVGSPSLIKSAYGDYMYPNVLWKWLNRFLKKNDLPHISVHGLRHTYASMLVDLNLDVKTISSQLGHADVGVTNRYIHQFQNKSNEIANQIDSMLKKDTE